MGGKRQKLRVIFIITTAKLVKAYTYVGKKARVPQRIQLTGRVAWGADDAVAHVGAARGVRAAIEGTLRRDFSKGLF